MSSLTRRVLLVLPFCLVAFGAAATAGAQPAGSIAGVVADAAGHPLANATVVLRDAAGEIKGTALTNAAGEYTFAGVPAGTYSVDTLNDKGQPIGSSGSVSVAADQAVTGVGITVSVVAAAAAGGASALFAVLLALIGAAGVFAAGAVGISASPSA